MSVDVIVWTCERYAHLIPKWLTFWERTFPLPYSLTYVVAGTNKVQVPRNYNRAATKFVTMRDNNLAANILDYLAYRQSASTGNNDDTKGNAPFLMLMDDHMVFEADAKLLRDGWNRIHANDVGCVRLVPWPGPTLDITGDFGTIDKSLEYAISLQASFWKPQTFQYVLERSWSPWDIELLGSKRAATYDKRFIGCRSCAINYKDYMLRGNPRPEHAAWVDAHL